MPKFVSTLLFGIFLTTSVLADNKQELAKELTDLMKVETQIDQFQAQFRQLFAVHDVPGDISPGEAAILQRHQSKMFDAMQESFSGRELSEHMVDLYASYFNEQELKDLIEFHRTPTGQQMIEITPMIMEESALFAQEKMMDLMPTIQAMTMDMEAEIAQYRQQLGEHTEKQQ